MILLTGATGYVGGHLLSTLMSRDIPVRCLSRNIERLPAPARAMAIQGDIRNSEALRTAMQGVGTAYYLVHSMTEDGDFSDIERQSARGFAGAARDAGVRRIIYLGGLGRGAGLSKHLASRQEVGDILRETGVPVIEFRASVIIGSGSISFELARTLVDKLPFMVTPRWVRTLAQPIAIDDIVAYLVEALDVDLPTGGIFEIGGAERVSYGDLMREYARQRGFWRMMLPVPVLTPRLSSLWLSLVVPRHARVGRLLIEGVRNETVVSDDSADRVFGVRPIGLAETVKRAVSNLSPEPTALRGWQSAFALVVSLFACFGTGVLGSLFASDAVTTWYPTIAKPAWTPPSWVFGPVWSLLYLMMAVSSWLIWRKDGIREARLPLGLFVAQLILNAAWSGVFFGLQNPALAFIELCLLWLILAATTSLFAVREKIAGVLLIPYVAWTGFAVVLNGAIVWMNRP